MSTARGPVCPVGKEVDGTLTSREARRRRAALGTTDALAWAAAVTLGTALRYDLAWHFAFARGVGLTAAIAALIALGVGLAAGLYRGRRRVASFEEVSALAGSDLVAGAMLLVVDLLDGRRVPASVPIIAGLIAALMMFALRYCGRLVYERRCRPDAESCARLLVFGAGSAAAEVVGSMLRDPDSRYLPVALLDDNPAKRRQSVRGVPVVGTRHDVSWAAARFDARMLLVAMPSASDSLIRELSDIAKDAGLAVKVLPSLRELMDGTATMTDLRTPTIPDLVGRREIRTDLAAAARYLTGRRVLVTGAGGSIGSELCRQIHRVGPAELIMLDRDESALHALQLSIEGRALLDSPQLVLLDIRDRVGLESLFADRRPDVVFHAAALKHLTMLENHPAEAVKTNVWGTLNVLEACLAHDVGRVVNVSTDKAVNASSVLGYSKRIGERLTATVAIPAAAKGSTYLSVRFGNVLGSRGSVMGTFQAQIAAGGPVTVTHPDVTRFFMSIEEAVQLVIHAGAVGEAGEALVLDMGNPVRIVELANQMISQAERPIELVYTGLRPGEKLAEELFGLGETDNRPRHPLISHVEVQPLHPGRVLGIDPFAPEPYLVDTMRQISISGGLRSSDGPDTLRPAECTPALVRNGSDLMERSRGWSLSTGEGVVPIISCTRSRRQTDSAATCTCSVCQPASLNGG